MHPESATPKTLAQENAKTMQKKCKQKCKKKCNFWKFVFVKHAHFQNLHFFRIVFAFVSHFFWHFCCIFLFFFCILPRFFAIFEKLEALTKPPPKNAKTCNLHVFYFFLYFFRIFFRMFLHFFRICFGIFFAFSDCIFLHFFKFLIF